MKYSSEYWIVGHILWHSVLIRSRRSLFWRSMIFGFQHFCYFCFKRAFFLTTSPSGEMTLSRWETFVVRFGRLVRVVSRVAIGHVNIGDAGISLINSIVRRDNSYNKVSGVFAPLPLVLLRLMRFAIDQSIFCWLDFQLGRPFPDDEASKVAMFWPVVRFHAFSPVDLKVSSNLVFSKSILSLFYGSLKSSIFCGVSKLLLLKIFRFVICENAKYCHGRILLKISCFLSLLVILI